MNRLNLGRIIPDGTYRTLLKENTTIYVRLTGDDSLDGRTETTAVASMARAMDIVNSLDTKSHSLIVDIGPGRFACPTVQMTNPGPYSVYFTGAGKDVTTLGTFTAYTPLSISNLTVEDGIQCQGTTLTTLAHPASGVPHGVRVLATGTRTAYGLHAIWTGFFYAIGTLEFAGDFSSCLTADTGSTVYVANGSIVSFVEGTTVSSGFMAGTRGSQIFLYTMTFNGAFIGRKFSLWQGAMVSGQGTLNNLNTVIPGTQDGDFGVTGKSHASIFGLTRAEAAISNSGAIGSSFGIASVRVNGTGDYTVIFSDPFPNVNYRVQVTPEGSSRLWAYVVEGRETGSCTVRLCDASGQAVNAGFSLSASH